MAGGRVTQRVKCDQCETEVLLITKHSLGSIGIMASSAHINAPAAPKSTNWEVMLENMLQTGDLQLQCSDGALLVKSQVLELASPEVMAGAVEAAKGPVRGSSRQSPALKVPCMEVRAQHVAVWQMMDTF